MSIRQVIGKSRIRALILAAVCVLGLAAIPAFAAGIPALMGGADEQVELQAETGTDDGAVDNVDDGDVENTDDGCPIANPESQPQPCTLLRWTPEEPWGRSASRPACAPRAGTHGRS